jgi:hypothetical protein
MCLVSNVPPNERGALEKKNMRSIAEKTVLLSILFIAFSTAVFGVSITMDKEIKLSPGSTDTTLLLKPLAFCVTEDGLFLVPDYRAGNVKVYDETGTLVTVFGRKGYGPEELIKPAFCYYSKEEKGPGRLGILDLGARKIFIYERKEKTDFKRIRGVNCLALGYDIQLKGNELLISGYKPDKDSTSFALYSIDLTNDDTSLLLPSYQKYGLKSHQQYATEYRRKPDIKIIGRKGWLDIQGENIYYVWEGDLRIVKINLESGKSNFFGKKTPGYVKPYASKKMLETRSKRDFNAFRKEKTKMSYVKNIFTSPKYALVIYRGPAKKVNDSNFQLQFYTLEGDFINEVSIPGKPDHKMYFDKDRSILYSLKSESDDDLNEHYLIIRYQISD